MANCKKCNIEDKDRSRVFICDSCKDVMYKCPECGGLKKNI